MRLVELFPAERATFFVHLFRSLPLRNDCLEPENGHDKNNEQECNRKNCNDQTDFLAKWERTGAGLVLKRYTHYLYNVNKVVSGTAMIMRQGSLDLLFEYTKTDSLRKHALAVEAAMRAYARKFGEDEEKWGTVGLLHDFDYEMYPQFPEHPMKGTDILKQHNYPEDVRRAILGHVPPMNVPRDTLMAKILFACDELCGFIVACAMVRPNKLADLEASSVKKKLKDKAFARGVNRDDIHKGIAELGVPLDEHITILISALRAVSHDLGL